jgi:tetratricopeptide (TPR) repeat protein
MKKLRLWHLLIVGIFMIGACATVPRPTNPYFEMPPDHLLQAERELFSLALQQQKNNKLKSSIDFWKRFLSNNPRSFRGYNNLGMAYYTNDQLSPAISAFEKGLALETFDHKIKDNLKRTLKFQVTLLRENKDYDAAIHFLKRIGELSEEPEKEKVALEIETMEDRIFEQVKRSNTLEDYEIFLARYPNSPKNSDEARRQIVLMRSQAAGEMPTMVMKEDDSPLSPDMKINPFVPESMETLKSSMPEAVISEDTIELVAAEKPKSEEIIKANEFPEGDEPILDPEPAVMVEPHAKEMKQKISEEKPTMKKPLVPESMKMPKSSMPEAVISEDTIEIVAAEKPKSEEILKANEFPKSDEPMLAPEPEVMFEPTSKEMKQKISEEKPSMKKTPAKTTAMKPVKKVKITTKITPLRVRADPSSKAEVVSQLPTASIVPMFQETGQWYQVEYLPGKKGWISKTYSKRVN